MPSRSRAKGLIAVVVVTAVWKKSLLYSLQNWCWESWVALRSHQHISTDVCRANAFSCSLCMVSTVTARGSGQVVVAQWIVLCFLVSLPVGWCQVLKWGLERWFCWLSVGHTIMRAWVKPEHSPRPQRGVRVKTWIQQTQCCRRQDRPQVYSLASLFGEHQVLWETLPENSQMRHTWERQQKSTSVLHIRCMDGYRVQNQSSLFLECHLIRRKVTGLSTQHWACSVLGCYILSWHS